MFVYITVEWKNDDNELSLGKNSDMICTLLELLSLLSVDTTSKSGFLNFWCHDPRPNFVSVIVCSHSCSFTPIFLLSYSR